MLGLHFSQPFRNFLFALVISAIVQRTYSSEICSASCGNDRNRISITLKEDNSCKKECPQNTYSLPRKNQVSDYIRIKTAIGDMEDFTFCSWISPEANVDIKGSVFSYATKEQANTFLIFFIESRLEIHINGEKKEFSLLLKEKTHLCVVVSRRFGGLELYLDGSSFGKVVYSKTAAVKGGGYAIVGQEQDAVLGNFDPTQAFSGSVQNLMLWNRLLSGEEIHTMKNNPCSCATGYAIALTTDAVQLTGLATAIHTDAC